MKLKCDCCGVEREFTDGLAALLAGWDAPPHFTTHVCCDLCPAVCVVMRLSHAKAHAKWAREGRPERFTVHQCGIDEDVVEAVVQ